MRQARRWSRRRSSQRFGLLRLAYFSPPDHDPADAAGMIARGGIMAYDAVVGPGAMMVHLALSGLPDWRVGDALKRFAYVHLAPDYATMARACSDALAGVLSAEPVLVVGQPTAIDPSRAPEGKHVLWVQVRVLPAHVKGDAAGVQKLGRGGRTALTSATTNR